VPTSPAFVLPYVCNHSRCTTMLIPAQVLIVYVMSVPDGNVSDGVQGAYLVATVLPGIILGGVLSQYVQWLAKRSGCIVGGFCIAMWIEVLSPGGVITSSSMLALFIALMCLAALAPSFLKKTKEAVYMVCSAFSGITALVLGIDCYSRAGLKELWVYTWRMLSLHHSILPLICRRFPQSQALWLRDHDLSSDKRDQSRDWHDSCLFCSRNGVSG
jgi:hypothetical protein